MSFNPLIYISVALIWGTEKNYEFLKTVIYFSKQFGWESTIYLLGFAFFLLSMSPNTFLAKLQSNRLIALNSEGNSL